MGPPLILTIIKRGDARHRLRPGHHAANYDKAHGGYAAWRSGEGYVDASAKSAMLQARYQAPWPAQGRPGTGLNAHRNPDDQG